MSQRSFLLNSQKAQAIRSSFEPFRVISVIWVGNPKLVFIRKSMKLFAAKSSHAPNPVKTSFFDFRHAPD